jgi:transcriptional regulator with XRE-family HTH domain
VLWVSASFAFISSCARLAADLAQVSPSQIWNIESGMRQGERLSLAVAKRLAVALGVSLDYLAAMDATLDAVHQPVPPAPKPIAKRQRTRKPAPVD